MRLSDALNALNESNPPQDSTKGDWSHYFEGNIDLDWRVGNVPQGGYLLGLLCVAVQRVQSPTSHPDIIHLTSHFLNSSTNAHYTIRVRTLRTGRTLVNLEAQLLQKGRVCIMSHFICGVLSDITQLPAKIGTLKSPSPLARRVPLSHPSACPVVKSNRPYQFAKHGLSLYDPACNQRNAEKFRGLPDGVHPSADSVDCGSWYMLTDKEEKLAESMIPFFADLIINMPDLLPKEVRGGYSWFPTVTMSVEFKSRVPTSSGFGKRTIGLYSQERFMIEGRHDCYAEVWTAPYDLDASEGDKETTSTWNDRMVCLAVSQQMALVVPMDVNSRKGEAKAKL